MLTTSHQIHTHCIRTTSMALRRIDTRHIFFYFARDRHLDRWLDQGEHCVLFVLSLRLTGVQTTAPGSIWDPEPTNIGMASFPKLGVSFGLFMAGVRFHPQTSFCVIFNLLRSFLDMPGFRPLLEI